ncbi:MAG: HAD-IC family P-type ATPase [Corallococcus sp.]|nr:HAD-IC family P-type ATPase [Bacillota bacterium]MCM1533081.1 HAD-IC family P-type ATPase [Corallococcus sp.]
MNKKVELQRVQADINQGLTSEEVKQRVRAKQTNKVKKTVGKSYAAIFLGNICTFFNLLGFIVFIISLIAHSGLANMTFIVIIVANTAIGIFQEIRSKIAVEKLSLVSEPTAQAVRDGAEQTIATRDIVLDDILLYAAGKQICTDSVVIIGEVEVDESMLTGESDPVKKKAGDLLYSGSYVISGNCTARADKVGKDNYIEQLSSRVKKAKMPPSELMKGIRRIIKFIAIIIFPLGIATFLRHQNIVSMFGTNEFSIYFENFIKKPSDAVVAKVDEALLAMNGSMLGMVPSGMVLLTSVALAVAALKLARKKVLVRELPCIEMLARVDTLCLDKTGTITDGSMTVDGIIPLNGTEEEIKAYLATVLYATGDDNMTAKALKTYVDGVVPYDAVAHLPFSSARKYSAATIKGHGTVAFGAAEFMFKKAGKDFNGKCNELLKKGLRVLAVGRSKKAISDKGTIDGLEPIAIIALQDTVRSDAPEIIGWFKDNNVDIKVISGDNPLSVSVIAGKVGVKDADKWISLDGMSDEQVAEAANKYTVFGRVTPEQKAILVRSMKQAGHTVAMTGDGVNDILAMRESDCAISVGCGTDAAKTVANLVLMDNKFSQMPKVVAEGRQVVNNIQNSASLFLMKTTMVVFTTLLCLIIGASFPFQAQHLASAEFFVIGISSFLLALKPNRNLIKGKFIPNVLKRTLPSGVAMFLSVAMTYAFSGVLNLTNGVEVIWSGETYVISEITTVAMFSFTFTGVAALLILLFPYDKINIGIGAIGVVGTVLCIFFYSPVLAWVSDLFGLKKSAPTFSYEFFDVYRIIFVVVNVLVMAGIIVGLKFLVKYIEKKYAAKRAVKAEQINAE